jgi:hypothetical protein
VGKVGNLLSHNMFEYCLNNPINHSDPNGDWVVDAIFLMADAAEFLSNPSLGAAGWILLDTISFLDPTGAASTGAHAAKAAHLAHAAQTGELIGRYSKVKAAVKGTKLEVHHLVEKRMAPALNVNKNKMLSVALTKTQHAEYTRRWRKAIEYGTDYENLEVGKIVDVVNNVYHDNEGLRRATLNWIRQTESM